MQAVSDAYIESMKSPFRNREYIRASIGIINSDAQNNAIADKTNVFTYFSDQKKPFTDYSVNQVYATAEENFSKVDGSMYFLPKKESGLSYYNNGMVTEALFGGIRISFSGLTALDIKGLTIDFGDSYPTKFTVENESVKYQYENNNPMFVTEDVFDGTSFILIKPTEMVNGQGRLRIRKINFGIVDSFGNDEVLSYSLNEFVSSTTESLPSKDIELVVDNQDSFYNPDNLESAIGYLELGQEVKVSSGYDVSGNGDIEWLPEMLTYLKSWNATDTKVQFICTDLFDSMVGTYYKGLFREQGISLYDLAVDVFEDAGFSRDKYYIDSYLKDILVYNPIPPVKHSEALQIIANAGRCVLYDDRDGRIHLQASFKPDMTISSNGETNYSKVAHVLNDTKKDAYAVCSKDFSKVDGSLFFMPQNQSEYKNVGYVSEQIANSDGVFTENPKLTVFLESGFIAYGFKVNFRNIVPKEFVIRTYYEDTEVETLTVNPTSENYDTQKRFELFDKVEIEFTKGYPNSRVFIDNITVGDVTNYHIERDDLNSSPVSLRQDKVRKISVIRNNYYKDNTQQELLTEEVELNPTDVERTFYFREPSYDLSVTVEENNVIKASIVDKSNYFVRVKFTGVTGKSTVRVRIDGKEYKREINRYVVSHNQNGEDIEWDNPLISTESLAKELEIWLASYYLGRVTYEIDWRGDPRVDANDLFYYELKDGREQMIRAYENSLSFNGAWSGKIKARAVVV